MTTLTDEEIAPLIDKYMRGNIVLVGDETEDSIIEEYFESDHANYTVGNDKGFICVASYEDYAIVHFAWFDGSYESRRKMVELGRYIYDKYTIKQKMPLFYQGEKNYYGNHSSHYDNGIWQFVV